MNFLAHLLLAAPVAEFRIGSVLGDFTNASRESLAIQFGECVAAGVIHHRTIDTLTDRHEAVNECVRILFSRQRHYARILLDVSYDYFLSKHWRRFSETPRAAFIQECYAVLKNAGARFPSRFRQFTARAIEVDLLNRYGTLEGIELTLKRLASIIRHETNLATARRDIEEHYSAIERSFLRLFPDLMQAAAVEYDCESAERRVF